MSINSKDLKQVLNGRMYAPAEEFVGIPEGVRVLEAEGKRFYTIEERLGRAVHELLWTEGYWKVSVDSDKK
jgi:hypothetical protein